MQTVLLVVALAASCLAAWFAVPREMVVRRTQRELDLAIVGHGYLAVSDASGEILFTRAGRMGFDSNGMLVHSSGRPVEPAISAPHDYTHLRITNAGLVLIGQGDDATEQRRGQLQLTRFANEAGLAPRSGGCFAQTEASGSPATGEPGDEGLGMIQQGWLEGPPTGAQLWLANAPFLLMVVSSLALLFAWRASM